MLPKRGGRVFVDGNQNVSGCVCGPDCEMPCWQRVGLTEQPCCKGCPSLELKPLCSSCKREPAVHQGPLMMLLCDGCYGSFQRSIASDW